MANDEPTHTDGRTSAFLDVEDMARGLTARLSRLDEEAARYTGAAANLTEAAQATRELIGAVRTVGEDATKAIQVVASVGGPEIVQRLASIESRMENQSSVLLGKMQLAVYLAGAAAVLALAAAVVAYLK